MVNRAPTVAALALVAACGTTSAPTTTERIESIPTRDGVTLPMLIVEPSDPQGVVVLFAGGNGELGLASGQLQPQLADNFLVRTRARFASEGFVAIVVDAPSDQIGNENAYRISPEQAIDANELVKWARQQWYLPVWLVGTSRGTISAANAAARGVAIDGLVLSSSVTVGDPDKTTLHDVAVEDITAPTLMIHDDQDACAASPIDGAMALSTEFKSPITWREITGGATPLGTACSAKSFHGFLGRDAQTVRAIAQFIDTRLP